MLSAHSLLFCLAASIVALDLYFVLFHKGIPNIRTAPAIRKKIIALLKEDFEARGGNPYTIVDVGSGNGLFTREIAKALPQAKVIGVEIAKQSIMWADWLKRRKKIDNIEYKKTDFFLYDFSEADAVVMYLIPAVMGALGEKLQHETKKGTLVTSNKFQLGSGWKPEETLRVKTLYAHQGLLHVYRKA